MRKHVLLDLSFHGFGHISQSAPVIDELIKRMPGLRLTVRSGAPGNILRSRFESAFEHVNESFDFGIVMNNAIEVNASATAEKYAAFHRDWEKRVEAEASRLASLSPDLVVCNVPYLTLAAASRAGIASVAFCSLNWADLYRHYCSEAEGSEIILNEIQAAYGSATAFLKIEPCMPMPDLVSARSVGPVARLGRDRRAEIKNRLGLREDERIGLVSMGGMPYSIDFESWPRFEKMRWLVPGAVNHPDMISFNSLGLPFFDLIASSDIMVTKPGYGSFVEAAMAGASVLFLSRGDWPEQSYLTAWLAKHARCMEVSRNEIETGDIGQKLERLLSMPVILRPAATGNAEAAEFLESLLT